MLLKANLLTNIVMTNKRNHLDETDLRRNHHKVERGEVMMTVCVETMTACG